MNNVAFQIYGTHKPVLNLDAGNIASYPGTGTLWTDLSIYKNNGTLINGPTFNSANGGSIVFDGINDYVNCGSSSSLKIGIFSISTWIKRTGNGTNVEEVFIHNQSGIYPTGGFQMHINRTTKKIVMTIRNSTNNSFTIVSNSSITTNLWVNIVAVFDGNTLYIYINGIQDINVASTISSLGGVTQPLGIGASIYDSSYNFKGNISQVLIQNIAISSIEILQNYNATKGRFGL